MRRTTSRSFVRPTVLFFAALLSTMLAIPGQAMAEPSPAPAAVKAEPATETCLVEDGAQYCFSGPAKVVPGQDIVLRGTSGFLAKDGVRGSVVNFFFDALFSGDPNTIFTTREIIDPLTGKVIGDKRSHGMVQAAADGTWQVTIPWPTTSNTTLTKAQLESRFAVGTTHGIRMLSGSLLDGDRQRGGTHFFTVVDSLDDEVRVTEPIYGHQSYRSTAGDEAVGWLEADVDSGNSAKFSGTGWLTREGLPSSIMLRWVKADGSYYQRPANQVVVPAQPEIWAVVDANDLGDVSASLLLPAGITGGDYLALELRTGGEGSQDFERVWLSAPLTIDSTPYIPDLGGNATCKAAAGEATLELAPGKAVPAANVGGKLRIKGTKWCNLIGGGSLIAIKIDSGAFSHGSTTVAAHYDANLKREVGSSPSTLARSNKTIWYVVEADKYGNFDLEMPIPSRTETIPAFREGAYTLQLLTRTLSSDPYYAGTRPDPQRSVQSAEFTVVAEGVPLDDVKLGEPQSVPDPLHVTSDLTTAAKGGVVLKAASDYWELTVPKAKAGDWVFISVFDDATPRIPWGTKWFQVGANGKVKLPLKGVDLPTGRNKVSVQDRDGELLGWTTVTILDPVPSSPPTTKPAGEAPAAAKTTKPAAAKPAAAKTQPAKTSVGKTTARAGSRPRTTVVLARTAAQAKPSQPKPATVPKLPIAGYQALTSANEGQVSASFNAEKVIRVNLPGVEPGNWVFIYLLTEDGQVAPIDWVLVGTDKAFSIAGKNLPDGTNKLAFLGTDGKLIGWISAAGAKPLPTVAPEQPVAAIVQAEPGGGQVIAPPQPTPDPQTDQTWTLVLVGLGVLFLAGCAATALVITAPKPTRAA